MAWTIDISRKVYKQIRNLPQDAKYALDSLIREIKAYGPVRGNWSNYSKIGSKRHHCHLSKGRPTYVAVWEIENKKAKLIEVIYVGTHEKAPY